MSQKKRQAEISFTYDRLWEQKLTQVYHLLIPDSSTNTLSDNNLFDKEGVVDLSALADEKRLLHEGSEYERALIKERSRRGKRSKAKAGIINVLGGAPFGYKYIRKTLQSTASYEIIEQEASIVREIFKLYTEEFLSLRAIAKELGSRQIKTRKGNGCWQATTIRNILSNAAYMGKAYFSRAERTERKRITKGLRAKGGYSAKNHCRKQRPSDEWIEIGVPAIVSTELFELAQQRLKINKVQSRRNTIEISLLQGLLVCSECAYSLHRVSSGSSKRKIYYYRCGGADSSRFGKAKKCQCRPVRQDYLVQNYSQRLRLYAGAAIVFRPPGQTGVDFCLQVQDKSFVE